MVQEEEGEENLGERVKNEEVAHYERSRRSGISNTQ